tara:strand:+ start:5440 stop:5733 length:294 start_codon:yes stop_codon:yes gene_type:complete
MFSLGWMEISIILIVTVILVGPKEIPTVIKAIKSVTSSLKKMSREFTSTVDELTHLDEVKDIKKEILDTKESIVKEGKELDEFVEKTNKEVLKDNKK